MALHGTAVIDASIVYGANRFLKGVHDEPDWIWANQYPVLWDKRHFQEFLHLILLYDRIILDHSSFTDGDKSKDHVGDEIEGLLETVNGALTEDLFEKAPLTGGVGRNANAETTCLLFIEKIRKDGNLVDVLGNVPIPWYYKSDRHVDFEIFKTIANNCGLAPSFIPAAMYAYRGLAYAGYSHSLVLDRDMSAAYVASPGRMEILELLLESDEIAALRNSKQQYIEYLGELGLPKNGYNFTRFPSILGVFNSPVSTWIESMSPAEGLERTIELRKKSEGLSLRGKWAKRIWGEVKSAALGSGITQSMENITAGRDVYQITYAQPAPN